ncbi:MULTISPECIES: dodecin family protein [unclassified Isoptericola]|uniref:dodecin family protein n=1 Tax=unclassified Isoptericola TaxID=2623355 RepID=UPI00271347A3|nr:MULTISPECIES: dodecin family protein [unclassified Isoptericola]MDO8144288.1 dodecin family protein [Isoptericola sp. 178]MDO8148142.1 dodecin family protein [Isoptericola sp. b515]MDO8151619.1 dodecin family protein [Isoptericola sp. b408]
MIDVIGTSSSSWEDAAAEAIRTAKGSLRDIRVAEVTQQDVVMGDGGELVYRTRLQLSFKYESE